MRRNTDIIKNIKRVSCRFDMDVPEERRAWQILRFRHDLLTGKKQDYTTILAKAMVGYYDRIDDRDLTNRELLNGSLSMHDADAGDSGAEGKEGMADRKDK